MICNPFSRLMRACEVHRQCSSPPHRVACRQCVRDVHSSHWKPLALSAFSRCRKRKRIPSAFEKYKTSACHTIHLYFAPSHLTSDQRTREFHANFGLSRVSASPVNDLGERSSARISRDNLSPNARSSYREREREREAGSPVESKRSHFRECNVGATCTK